MKKLAFLGAMLLLVLSIQHVHADAYPDGCTSTTKYSSTTGHLCSVPPTCQPGDLYDAQTGQPCTSDVYFPGCTSLNGYSVTTGVRCDGALHQVVQSLINPTNPQVVVPIVTMTVDQLDTPTTIKYMNNFNSRVIAVDITNTASIPVTLSTATVDIDQLPWYQITDEGGMILGSGFANSSTDLSPQVIPAGKSLEMRIYGSMNNFPSSMIDMTMTTSIGLSATDTQGDSILIPAVTATASITQ